MKHNTSHSMTCRMLSRCMRKDYSKYLIYYIFSSYYIKCMYQSCFMVTFLKKIICMPSQSTLTLFEDVAQIRRYQVTCQPSQSVMRHMFTLSTNSAHTTTSTSSSFSAPPSPRVTVCACYPLSPACAGVCVGITVRKLFVNTDQPAVSHIHTREPKLRVPADRYPRIMLDQLTRAYA